MGRQTKKLNIIIIGWTILTALLGLLLSAILNAPIVWAVDEFTIVKAEVYRGYLESNDMLFVIEYINTYTPYYPDSDPSRYFDLQLRSANGATVMAQTVCKQWGDKPGSIYLSADQAAPLTSGSAYRIYIRGAFNPYPTAYYILLPADWRGNDLNYLDAWIRLTAQHMETYYNKEFLTSLAAKGEVLNVDGGIIFTTGIPALDIVRPNMFEVAIHTPGYVPQTFVNVWKDATYKDILGPTVAGWLDAGGDIIGIDGKDFGAFLLLGVYAFCIIFLFSGGHATAGLALAFPFILLGGWIRLIDMVLVGVLLAVFVFLIVLTVWWSRT